MTASTAVYRDFDHAARIRYEALAEQDEPLVGPRLVYRRRVARIAAGGTGIAFALAMAGRCVAAPWLPFDAAPATTTLLLLAWPAMGLAWMAGWCSRTRCLPRTGELATDLALLEDERAHARARVTALEARSLALPMIAVALLAPLTLHFIANQVFGDAGAIDKWIAMSLALVGHAHVALAICYGLFARKASRMSSEELGKRAARMGWKAWGITVAVSAVPGVVLYAIPPILTALTGLCFNPLLVWVMTRAVLRERAELS